MAGLRGDFDAEFAEVAEKGEEKSATTGSNPKDGCVGSATSIRNGSTECC
jgi:hypothetical protein